MDKIEDILRDWKYSPAEIITPDEMARRIRQQIGRELLELEIKPVGKLGYVYTTEINEVCQLKEE